MSDPSLPYRRHNIIVLMTEDEITAEIEYIVDDMSLENGSTYPPTKIKHGPEIPGDPYGTGVIRISRPMAEAYPRPVSAWFLHRRVSSAKIDGGGRRRTILRKRLRAVIMQHRNRYFWTERHLITIILHQHGGGRTRMEAYDFAQDGYYSELERRFLELHNDAEVRTVGHLKPEPERKAEPAQEAVPAPVDTSATPHASSSDQGQNGQVTDLYFATFYEGVIQAAIDKGELSDVELDRLKQLRECFSRKPDQSFEDAALECGASPSTLQEAQRDFEKRGFLKRKPKRKLRW